ncbi:MAG: hypothetical protein H6Q60_1163 [Oscillospiraceae bacterium]|nr:hypothetical protein [Oscillospiraceae bacterium]
MADYAYYTGTYLGTSITESDFLRLATRAASKLAYYKRVYTVTENTDAENMAVCAMADALYYFETAANGGLTQSSSVGSVSSSAVNPSPDLSEKAQAAELYRCARLYLEIYRGAGGC